MFMKAFFTIAELWKNLNVYWWIDKENEVCMCIHVCVFTNIHTMEYYSVTKKNDILPFTTTWMKLDGIKLSEAHQTKTNTV